ncbi:MAG: hypothetical protein SOZ94_04735 [Prevotella sp.]|nr:hypothetical protein [Bacteroidales bacterium]MDD7660789.1 hypothetical protein [Bacteroidales bacterium]MDY3742190.1 hypothetical protein [Prevotella sp.]MDY5036346.1 hypothetical protein [Prevotella sp.]
MKKTVLFMALSILILSLPLSLTSCSDEDTCYDADICPLVGKTIDEKALVVGVMHYDENINHWYVEKGDYSRYYIASPGDLCQIKKAEEGATVILTGILCEINNKWLDTHDEYKKLPKGIYVFLYRDDLINIIVSGQ